MYLIKGHVIGLIYFAPSTSTYFAPSPSMFLKWKPKKIQKNSGLCYRRDCLQWPSDTFYLICLVCRADETFQAEDGAADILRVAKDHLLQGLADDNRDLKLVFSSYLYFSFRL